jgi:serine protease Do
VALVQTRRVIVAACLVGAIACDRGSSHATGSAGDSGATMPPGATLVPNPSTPQVQSPPPPVFASPPATASNRLSAQPASFAPIVHAVDPSVVTIKTLAEEIEVSPFTHRQRRRQTGGLGTGFVVDRNGIIVTNNHVVEGAQEIQVKTSDERELPAKVVGTDPPTDIAVVRIDAKDLHLQALPLGDSDAIDVGDWVVAIGNPFGFSHTVSAGILSAKGRTKEDFRSNGESNPFLEGGYYDFLQTDASINPGNSGGPLLNLKGEVVGMNSATNRAAQGLSFAIPINMIKQLLPVLLRDGHLTRSALGVHIVDPRQLPKEDRQALGLPEGERTAGGVVADVLPGGAADRAGLQPGDVIVAFDGTPIERSTQLQWLASTAGVGRSAALRVQRAGKTFDIRVVLGPLRE